MFQNLPAIPGIVGYRTIIVRRRGYPYDMFSHANINYIRCMALPQRYCAMAIQRLTTLCDGHVFNLSLQLLKLWLHQLYDGVRAPVMGEFSVIASDRVSIVHYRATLYDVAAILRYLHDLITVFVNV